jgi:hypothetical protein
MLSASVRIMAATALASVSLGAALAVPAQARTSSVAETAQGKVYTAYCGYFDTPANRSNCARKKRAIIKDGYHVGPTQYIRPYGCTAPGCMEGLFFKYWS